MSKSNNEVAKHWAIGNLGFCKSSSMFTEEGVIYSYGSHFPIAVLVKTYSNVHKVLCLFTTEKYSHTTEMHKRVVTDSMCFYCASVHVIHLALDKSMVKMHYTDMIEKAKRITFSELEKKANSLRRLHSVEVSPFVICDQLKELSGCIQEYEMLLHCFAKDTDAVLPLHAVYTVKDVETLHKWMTEHGY